MRRADFLKIKTEDGSFYKIKVSDFSETYNVLAVIEVYAVEHLARNNGQIIEIETLLAWF